MVYFRRYVSSRPRSFHLVSFQKTKRNEKKIKKKKLYEKIRNENEQDESKMKRK